MKRPAGRGVISIVIALLFFVAPLAVSAQTYQPEGPPPIEQPLLREGSLAVQLAAVLGLEGTNDEVLAENRLGDAGINPRNGWIADYPVTPDIVGELRESIAGAADSGRIALGREEALGKFDEVIASLGLAMGPNTGAEGHETEPGNGVDYLNQTEINNYYYSEGPPVVTYYAPPAAYYDLYSWVPYPFWYGSFRFPGFFVLYDFYRPIFVGHRRVFVSNHYHDSRHGYYRIEPRARFDGKSHGGIGVSHGNRFISSGERRRGGTSFAASSVQTGSDTGNFNRSQPRASGSYTGYQRNNEHLRRGYDLERRNFDHGRPGFTNQSRGSARPSGSFISPPRSFNAPARSFSPPVRSFTPPVRSFTPPVKSFTPPVRSFSNPARSFSNPTRTFSTPARSFNNPTGTFNSRPQGFSHRSYGSGGGGSSFHGGGYSGGGHRR